MSIFKNGMGRDLRLWPMLCLLLIVVLAPTACLVWFMNRAIENERLAMCKTLEDAYRRDLSDAQSRLEQFWRDRTTILDECAADKSDSAVFAKCVTSGWADSVVCYDGLGGVCYPAAPASPSDQSSPSAIRLGRSPAPGKRGKQSRRGRQGLCGDCQGNQGCESVRPGFAGRGQMFSAIGRPGMRPSS